MAMIEQRAIPVATQQAWRFRPGRLVLYGLVIILALMFGFPLFWTLMSSLKTVPEMFEFPPRIIPKSPQWINYVQVMTTERMPVARWMLNSTIIVLLATSGVLITCSLVAYSFARFEYRGR